ncbi:GGDEF domain-containing protein [Marinomonas dokdonensis]|uniref:GGDEF domain-containing protein n=1 Tax=Marinomonas dokdonensis TaxID=328224 RepID=UPI00405574A8
MFRRLVVKFGRVKVTSIVTVVTVLASLAVTYVAKGLLGLPVNMDNIILSILSPVFITPPISWVFLGLTLKIHKLEKEQRYLATYDSLTGLRSRGAFFSSYGSLAKLAQRQQQKLCVAIIDLDDFKKVNDQYGHAAGDETLKAFANIIKQDLRSSDLAGRIGGEEFALVLVNTDLDNALRLLEKVRQHCEQYEIHYLDHVIRFTISVGVTTYDGANELETSELLRQSDEALYTAKNTGKNRIVNYQNQKMIMS